MSPIVLFLRGEGVDASGRTLREILAMDDTELEVAHDFIQWLFPLLEESQQILSAPILSDEDIALVRADDTAQENLRRALVRMTAFYEAQDHWLVLMDHNHLRITRILRSIRLLVSLEEAEAFYNSIMEHVRLAGTPIRARNLAFWTDALGLSYPL